MFSGTYQIYKSKGAAQFSLMVPKFNEKGFVTREGAIFLEAAPGNGNKDNPVWDWEQKVTFAIGLPDIAIMLDQTKDAPRLVHDNQGTVKTLEFKPGTGNFEGTYLMSLSEGAKDGRRQVTVPLSNGEYNLLLRLFSGAAPLLINWSSNTKGRDRVQDQDSK